MYALSIWQKKTNALLSGPGEQHGKGNAHRKQDTMIKSEQNQKRAGTETQVCKAFRHWNNRFIWKGLETKPPAWPSVG